MTSAPVAQGLARLWYGDCALAALLQPLALLFGLGVRLRRTAYRRGWLASGHPGVPVIVVGNLTAGGAGKTPLVVWLVERLRAAGMRPGIVSRGYGGAPQAEPLHVGAATGPDTAGDEPVLLARRTGVPVMVCVDRLKAARAVVREGADVIVADDGLQHYALRRDVEILVVDGARRWGNGRLLPAGPLREPPARAAEVDAVVVNGGEARAGEAGFTLRLGEAVSLATGERRPLAAFAGQRVHALAGIGNPARFHEALAALGMQVAPVPVADHGRTDLAGLRREAPWPILMTEKDAVKYAGCRDPQAWYLPVDVQMFPGSAEWLMTRIASRLKPGGAIRG